MRFSVLWCAFRTQVFAQRVFSIDFNVFAKLIRFLYFKIVHLNFFLIGERGCASTLQ